MTEKTERIDHAAAAKCRCDQAEAIGTSPENMALALGLLAQAEATLALVEQQRIANLIALGGPTHPKLCEQVSSDAATALTEWNSHQNTEMGGWYALRPEVAAALGIEEVQS